MARILSIKVADDIFKNVTDAYINYSRNGFTGNISTSREDTLPLSATFVRNDYTQNTTPDLGIVVKNTDITTDISKMILKGENINIENITTEDKITSTGRHRLLLHIPENIIVNQTATITISGDFIQYPVENPKITPTYNLANCSISPQPTEINNGDEITFTVSKNNDTDIFTNIPNITGKIDGVTFSNDFTLDTNGNYILTKQFNFTDANNTEITINAIANTIEIIPTITIEGSTVKIRPNISGSEYVTTLKNGVEYLIETESDNLNGYFFKSIPKIIVKINGVSETINMLDQYPEATNKTKYYLVKTFNFKSENDTVDVIAIATDAIIIEPIYNIDHCTINPKPLFIKPKHEYTFNVKADEGFIFKTTPYLNLKLDGLESTVTFDKVDDYTFTLTYTFNFVSTGSTSIEFNLFAKSENNPIAQKYGFITLYSPTTKELIAISRKRLLKVASSNEGYADVDLGQYITSLKRIFCKIPTDESENVVLGIFNTGVSCKSIPNDNIELSFGDVQCNGYYNNAQDLTDTSIQILLPFCNVIDIETININSKITVKMNVNVLSGNATVHIYSDDILIKTVDTNISIKIPYTLYGQVSQELSVHNQRQNDSAIIEITPQIIIYEKINNNSHEVYTTSKYDLISNEKGFFRIEHIEMNMNMKSDEYELIINELKNGCYIS